MKHRRIPALALALVLSVGLLASAAAAADTDTQSQATQNSARDEAQVTPGTQEGQTGTKQRREKKQEAAEPENAIGKDAAKEKALADAGLSADAAGKIRTRVSESDGTVYYKVRFTSDGRRYSYKIDAVSGEILDKSVKEDSGKTRRTKQKHGRTEEAQDTAETT